MQKHFALVATLVASALILSSCSADPDVSPSATVATSSNASSPGVVEEALPDAAQEATSDAATVEWAESTFGTFEPTTESGSGRSLIPLDWTRSYAGIVEATSDGSFSLDALPADRSARQNVILSGSDLPTTATFGLHGFSAQVSLDVWADGPWSVSLKPISTLPAFSGSVSGDEDSLGA